MASLTIRNIPDELMEKLRERATEQKRSVNAQVLHWLEDSASREFSLSEGEALNRKIESLRQSIYQRHGMSSDSVELIRRMREERTNQILRAAEGSNAPVGRRSRR